MFWRTSLVFMIILLFGCKREHRDGDSAFSKGSLIESHELAAHLGNPELKIIDVRNADAYFKGHIPGALQISRRDIENFEDTLPGMRAKASQMEKLLSGKGIEPEDRLVIYDDRGNPEAARLWCILRGYGKGKIQLLNGGLKSWVADGYTLDTLAIQPTPTAFSWSSDTPPGIWIDADELAMRINDPNSDLVVIDTRTAEEFHGMRQKKNAKRAGRIPGARHLDWADLMDFHGNHRLKQKNEIRSIISKFGLTEQDSIVFYCHSGVRSSFSTFVLREVMDYPYVWNYDGSWTEWSRLKHYPIEVDSVTTIFN